MKTKHEPYLCHHHHFQRRAHFPLDVDDGHHIIIVHFSLSPLYVHTEGADENIYIFLHEKRERKFSFPSLLTTYVSFALFLLVFCL